MNQQNLPRNDRQEALHWLIESFPAAFFQKNKQVRPLKLGIFEDIIDFYERLEVPPFSKKVLREAMNYYSASKAYLTCQTEKSARIDLYGNMVDNVTAEQALYAKKRYEQRYAKNKQEINSEE
jgi:ProP effector